MKSKSDDPTSLIGKKTVEEVLRRRAELLARDARTEKDDLADANTVLVFIIGDERYAVEISHVWEVTPFSGVTPVPGSPSMLRGIVNYRGELTPLYDLTAIISGEPHEKPPTGSLLVLGEHSAEFAIAVNRIEPPRRIDLNKLQKPFSDSAEAGSSFVKGIMGDGTALLNAMAMFGNEALFINF